MIKVCILTVLLLITGCQSTNIGLAEPNYTKVIKLSGTRFNAKEIQNSVLSEIKFESNEDLINEEKHRALNEMWSKKKTEKRLSIINRYFKNGRFYIIGYASTIGAASNGYLKAILIQNGKLLQSRSMKGVANTPIDHGGYGSGMWWNSTLLSAQGIDTDYPFEIRVINSVNNTISGYEYTPEVE